MDSLVSDHLRVYRMKRKARESAEEETVDIPDMDNMEKIIALDQHMADVCTILLKFNFTDAL